MKTNFFIKIFLILFLITFNIQYLNSAMSVAERARLYKQTQEAIARGDAAEYKKLATTPGLEAKDIKTLTEAAEEKALATKNVDLYKAVASTVQPEEAIQLATRAIVIPELYVAAYDKVADESTKRDETIKNIQDILAKTTITAEDRSKLEIALEYAKKITGGIDKKLFYKAEKETSTGLLKQMQGLNLTLINEHFKIINFLDRITDLNSTDKKLLNSLTNFLTDKTQKKYKEKLNRLSNDSPNGIAEEWHVKITAIANLPNATIISKENKTKADKILSFCKNKKIEILNDLIKLTSKKAAIEAEFANLNKLYRDTKETIKKSDEFIHTFITTLKKYNSDLETYIFDANEAIKENNLTKMFNSFSLLSTLPPQDIKILFKNLLMDNATLEITYEKFKHHQDRFSFPERKQINDFYKNTISLLEYKKTYFEYINLIKSIKAKLKDLRIKLNNPSVTAKIEIKGSIEELKAYQNILDKVHQHVIARSENASNKTIKLLQAAVIDCKNKIIELNKTSDNLDTLISQLPNASQKTYHNEKNALIQARKTQLEAQIQDYETILAKKQNENSEATEKTKECKTKMKQLIKEIGQAIKDLRTKKSSTDRTKEFKNKILSLENTYEEYYKNLDQKMSFFTLNLLILCSSYKKIYDDLQIEVDAKAERLAETATSSALAELEAEDAKLAIKSHPEYLSVSAQSEDSFLLVPPTTESAEKDLIEYREACKNLFWLDTEEVPEITALNDKIRIARSKYNETSSTENEKVYLDALNDKSQKIHAFKIQKIKEVEKLLVKVTQLPQTQQGGLNLKKESDYLTFKKASIDKSLQKSLEENQLIVESLKNKISGPIPPLEEYVPGVHGF